MKILIKNIIVSCMLAVCLQIGVAGQVFAVDSTWVGNTSSDYFDVSNWSAGALPDGTATFDGTSANSLVELSGTLSGTFTTKPTNIEG